jgi:3-hydroxyacyl-CoA dehydrogenase
MPLVEIVHCNDHSVTLPSDVASCVETFVRKINKTGIWVKNLPGFVGNRMIFVYFMESMLLLEDGATVDIVDTAIREFGFPMGPFQMADMSGLDVGFRIRQQQRLVAADGLIVSDDITHRQTKLTRHSSIADELYKVGRLGQKSGAGFYNYEKGSQKPLSESDEVVDKIVQNERLKKGKLRGSESDGRTPKLGSLSSGVYVQYTSRNESLLQTSDIINRLLFSLCNEGFNSLGEGGVVSFRPGDIDVIYSKGYGWPPYRGGPMFYADHHIGLSNLLEHLKSLARRFPDAPWFQPAPLLVAMVRDRISIFDLQAHASPQKLVQDLLMCKTSKL